MDRLRKRLEEFRLKVREFIKYNWHNEPEGDKFRSLGVLFVLGAVRNTSTKNGQRICWKAYCVWSFVSYLMICLIAVDEILSAEFDLTITTCHAAIVVASGLCFVKNSILNRHFESIQAVLNFVNSKPVGSKDSLMQIVQDSTCRKRCFQRIQSVILALLSMILINQIVFNVPILGINELFGTPKVLQYLGPKFAKGVHFLFLLTFCPMWISKYNAGTVTICSLLYGLNTEYEIFVRDFDNILDNVHSDVEEELPSTLQATPDLKRFQRDQLYWKCLKHRVNNQVKLSVQFAENMQLLTHVVNIFFAIIYYSAMVWFSPIIYVVLTMGLSGPSLFLTSGIVIQLLECYMWCRLIDSLKDTNENLELKIMHLMTKIPCSQLNHKKYSEMRTTLCIMRTFIRNHEPFSCGGVFPISVEAFTELLNIGYTVFTFLRDMGKKDLGTHRRMKQRKQK